MLAVAPHAVVGREFDGEAQGLDDGVHLPEDQAPAGDDDRGDPSFDGQPAALRAASNSARSALVRGRFRASA